MGESGQVGSRRGASWGVPALTPLPLFSFSFCLPGSSKVGEVAMRQGPGLGQGGGSTREGVGPRLLGSREEGTGGPDSRV